MIPITANTPMNQAQFFASSGRIGSAILMNPYVPSFSRMAARSTEPTVGAAVWASGNHVWKGNIGTLTAKPRKSAANTQKAKVPANTPLRADNSTMSKVRSCPPEPERK